MNKRALIVVTNHNQLGTSSQKTGWYLSEVSHVYWPLFNDGFTVDFASPKGGSAPLEMDSLKLDDPENRSFVEKMKIENSINTISLKDVDPKDYQVIYFSGGHGTMWDFPDNDQIERITSAIYEKGGLVAAVCHGPAALTSVKLSYGKFLVHGKKLCSFTNAEEKEVRKDKMVPFMLETRLKERGAIFQGAHNWSDHVVISDRLLTGQNPQSASSLGKAIVNTFEALEDAEEQRFKGQSGYEEQSPQS